MLPPATNCQLRWKMIDFAARITGNDSILGGSARAGFFIRKFVLFVEQVDDANRLKFEVTYVDADTGITVQPVFVATGLQT